jgi:hypothetical protein
MTFGAQLGLGAEVFTVTTLEHATYSLLTTSRELNPSEGLLESRGKGGSEIARLAQPLVHI